METLQSTKWTIDKAHSTVEFKAKHLMITTITGTFKEYDADIETEGNDFSTAKIEFTANTDSVYTGNEQRDGHLKSNDFFNSEQFPKLHFKSTEVKKVSGEEYELTGDLTIRDVTKTIKLKVEFEGQVTDPWGNTKLGFQLSGKINRKEFGLSFHVLNQAGNLLVSDDIKIVAEVQIQKTA